MNTPTPRNIDPEIQSARDELAASLDELLDRVHPRTVANEFTSATKQAASDAASFVSGKGFPHSEDSSRARNAKAALGVAVGGAALLVFSVLTKKKK